MEDAVRAALERDRTIDITTTGRHSGAPRRLEIWFFNLEGQIVITGTPGPRDWYANLVARPAFTFHLKESVTADLPARAVPVTDEPTRRQIFARLFPLLGRPAAQLDAWVAESPLVEVDFTA